jgi:hypothetical protein
MCLFPAVVHSHKIVLTTCTNGRDTTWDIALARGYTLMPKPYTHYSPDLLRAPSWITSALRAWRSRGQHPGLFAAFRAERSKAIEDARRENERRQADAQTTGNEWRSRRNAAHAAFHTRHS